MCVCVCVCLYVCACACACMCAACVCVFVCMCVCDCEYGLRWSVCATARGARRNTGKHRVAGLAPSVARIWMVCSIWLSISMDLDLSGVPLRLAQFAKGSLRLSFRKNSVRKHPSAVNTLCSAARSVPPADGAARTGTGTSVCASRRARRLFSWTHTACYSNITHPLPRPPTPTSLSRAGVHLSGPRPAASAALYFRTRTAPRALGAQRPPRPGGRQRRAPAAPDPRATRAPNEPPVAVAVRDTRRTSPALPVEPQPGLARKAIHESPYSIWSPPQNP